MTNLDDTYIIDQFEDKWAVLEVGVGETFNIPRAWLPEDAGEGDVLKLTLGGGASESVIRFALDVEETEARRTRARGLRESLPKAPEGDLEL